LTANRDLAEYFEATATATALPSTNITQEDSKLSANTIMGIVSSTLNQENKDIKDSKVSTEMLGGLIKRIKDETISKKIAKEVFKAMWNGEGSADEIIENQGLKQVTDTGAIEKLVDDVIAANPDQVKQYQQAPTEKQGKLIGFFVGQVMKKSQGKANPQQVNQMLQEKLK